MKKSLLFMVALIFGSISTFAQNQCSKYYPMQEGASFTYDIYNKKGKPDGTTSFKISDIKNEGGETQASMNMSYADAKGKNNFESKYSMTCTGEGIKIDYMSLMPSQMTSQFEDMDMDMEMTGTDVQLPNNLSVGQQLDDANISVKMNMAGINMKINVSTTNRHVLKQESITTPAGSFDCFVLSETIKSKSMGANLEMESRTWLAEGIGMIRNETYKKNGTMESRSELKEYSK